MCDFFSFVTEPEKHGGKRFYFNWDYRKEHLKDDNHDSHSSICRFFGLDEDVCNKYEFNPLTKKFEIDQINSQVDDRIQAEDWVNKLDFKRIIEPLIVKPIVNPFDLPKVVRITDEHIDLLKQWDAVRDAVRNAVWVSVWDAVGVSVRDAVWISVRDAVGISVRDAVGISVRDAVRNAVWVSVWDAVGISVRDAVGISVRDAVGNAVWDAVGISVRDAVRNAVGVYISSFFNIKYKYDFSSCVKLWEHGLVPSFDGTTWRLHSGKNADVVFEWKKDGE